MLFLMIYEALTSSFLGGQDPAITRHSNLLAMQRSFDWIPCFEDPVELLERSSLPYPGYWERANERERGQTSKPRDLENVEYEYEDARVSSLAVSLQK